MIQVAVNSVLLSPLPPSKAKHKAYLSSGRGGSGNIRRSQAIENSNQSDHPPVSGHRERRSNTTTGDNRSDHSELPSPRRDAEHRQFMSSGRGGSGNIQPSTSADLETHPLTASILSQHSATQAQYEQWIRKNHAESKLAHSSGRGGSGNISDLRRPRSRSQGSSAAPKRHFFTTKGRNKGGKHCDSLAESHGNNEDRNRDKRTSYVTCSTGSFNDAEVLVERCSQDSRISEAVASSINSVSSNPFSIGEAITGRAKRRETGNFSIRRWSRVSSSRSTSSVISPPSLRSESHNGSSGSSYRVYSPTPLILEDEDKEYVSFLDL